VEESVIKELERFLEEQSVESFLRLRAAVAASKGYAPYGDTPEAAGSFAAREDWAQAKASLLALMPTYFLNPQIHTLLAYLHHKLGDETTAQAEFELATRFMSGILSTGTGDRDHPCLVPNDSDSGATVYYLPGTTGWGTEFGGRPTALWSLPNPGILTTAPSFGIQANGFGFIISWATNLSVVVEAATNLANPSWSPVATNALTGGSSYFSDAEWTNYPGRFYRLRSP
jgi:hypothetical protein